MDFSKTISQNKNIKILSEPYLFGWNPILGVVRIL